MKFLPRKAFFATVILSALTSITHAANNRIITAPSCLIKLANVSAEVLARAQDILLLKVDASVIDKLSDAKHQTKTPCGGFKDVTARWNQTRAFAKQTDNASFLTDIINKPRQLHRAKSTYAIRFQTQANQLIKQLNPQRMWDSLTTFSSSKDRHADSAEGVAAANWIQSEIETAAHAAGRHDITVSFIKTTGHKQPSVVAKLGNGQGAGVVIGAHMDTTSGYYGKKPGADDDGSGSMTVLESARTIIESGATFKHPIYFIWYSAEELGLIGSQNVVAKFQQDHIPIAAVMHFDMTGFAYHNEPTIWLMKDNVDSDLTNFVDQIIKTYTGQPVKYTRCGYACSDHASWDEQGYAAALPAEARFEDTNPVMHSSQDTIDKLSITHMTDYAKIATAFAVELAEPTE